MRVSNENDGSGGVKVREKKRDDVLVGQREDLIR